AYTIGGSAATSVDGTDMGDGYTRIDMYYRKGVSTGSNSVSVTVDGNASELELTALSYCGVDQTTPISGPTTEAIVGDASIDVTSTTSNLVVDFLKSMEVGTTISPTSPQVQRANFGNGSADYRPQ